jgi:hypothetical protein
LGTGGYPRIKNGNQGFGSHAIKNKELIKVKNQRLMKIVTLEE